MEAQAYIRQSIRQRGWSIPQFAKRAHVSIGLAYKWLSEDPAYRIVPSPASCEKIADAFGIDSDYMLELAGHRRPRAERSNGTVAGELSARIHQLEQTLSKYPRAVWLAVMEANDLMTQALALQAPSNAETAADNNARRDELAGDQRRPRGPLRARYAYVGT